MQARPAGGEPARLGAGSQARRGGEAAFERHSAPQRAEVERETVRSVRIFGGFAHVLSAYETKQSEHASEPFARGVNSLQLIREGDGWRVLSLLWDEEGPSVPLMLAQLFDPRSPQ